MPSIATLVDDFHAGTVVGVGAMPDSTAAVDNDISGTCRVKYKYADSAMALSGTNRLSCAPAPAGANGRYLFFQDDWTTAADMDATHPIVVSGKFSGCMWKVYRTGVGQYKCLHIARPGGAESDLLVQLVTQGTAVQHKWVEVQSIGTAGMIQPGVTNEVFLVSQFVPGTSRIKSVALAVNNQGMVVNHVYRDDPA
ncbi:hypothetical protein DYQ86_18935 [Acidobacteria bacterium AB60]|nr:hypothetical protein DYQ86_18935 [Acidobacteria bacterium AB60]